MFTSYVHAKKLQQQKGLCHFVVVSVDFTEAHTPKSNGRPKILRALVTKYNPSVFTAEAINIMS